MAYHPILTALTELETRVSLRDAGYGRWQINRILTNFSESLIEQAAVRAKATLPTQEELAAATGDHPILDAIMAFLSSPQGQALVAALIQMLLSMIAGG